MNIDDELIWVTAVADANTPPEFLPFVGRIVGIPKDLATPLANGDPGVVYGVPGRARLNGASWEWVMGTVDGVVEAVNAMMSGGWRKVAARDAVVSIARAMLRYGITGSDVQAACAGIINAVLLEKAP